MAERTTDLVLGTATVTTGLLAGLYYSFAVAIMPGLGRTDDAVYVAAMNEINKAIVNPVFMISFLGAPALTIAAAVLLRRSGSEITNRWVLAAAALNAVALVTTIAINVPLNDALLKDKDLGAFETTWLAWNVVRTVATAGALGCLVRGLLIRRTL
jgi:uncharacterized membrane protein